MQALSKCPLVFLRTKNMYMGNNINIYASKESNFLIKEASQQSYMSLFLSLNICFVILISTVDDEVWRFCKQFIKKL